MLGIVLDTGDAQCQPLLVRVYLSTHLLKIVYLVILLL